MKKRYLTSVLGVSILSGILFVLSSCAMPHRLETGFTPQSYRSPQLNFAAVNAIGIMPVNPYTNPVPELESLINDGQAAELRRAQSAWQVLSFGDVLRAVNDLNIGRGYQNYLADLNTYASSAGVTPNFTAETKAFFQELQRGLNVEALLFSSYGFSEVVVERNPNCRILCAPNRRSLRVNVSLYHIPTGRVWWTANLGLTGTDRTTPAEFSQAILRALAENFGQGALRQL
jgi:hypothetical protein